MPLLTYSSIPDRPRRLLSSSADDTPRILSRAESEALFKRIVALATGGGATQVTIRATWTSSLRWGRNRPTASSSTVEQLVSVTRVLNGGSLSTELTKLDDASIKQAMQELEQPLAAGGGGAGGDSGDLLGKQVYLTPTIWDDTTYQMTPQALSDAARKTVDPVVDAKLVGAGFAEIGAVSWAIFNTHGLDAYAAATGGSYTQTVRNAEGTASGWAGRTHMDWAKLDVPALAATALRHCIDSANPLAVEPGRYTAILEADVVSRMMSFAVEAMSRQGAEEGQTVYTQRQGVSKIGQQVFDPRMTITSDPTDPECGFIPFAPDGTPYRKVTWVENGILKELAYDRDYARKKLGSENPLLNPQAFRISGGDTSLEEMIATTDRGIYVTNTTGFAPDDPQLLTLTAVTRNGLWLIEHGKIVHPIKNLWINESPMFIFNRVLQIGRPVRTYGADRRLWDGVLRDLPARALNDGRVPIVAPPVKVRDFNFTRMIDAI